MKKSKFLLCKTSRSLQNFCRDSSMLTFCVRGERFSHGHWDQMIGEGYIRRVLERLHEIQWERRKDNP